MYIYSFQLGSVIKQGRRCIFVYLAYKGYPTEITRQSKHIYGFLNVNS